MKTASLWIAWLVLPAGAMAADDFKVIQLEQEVRALQREVQTLSRQVEELRMQASRPGERTLRQPVAAAAPAAADWVDAKKWRQLKTGMSELEVIAALGAPTSMRADNGARVLLYAMEIGATGYLGGSVTLRDRVVTNVQIPALK